MNFEQHKEKYEGMILSPDDTRDYIYEKILYASASIVNYNDYIDTLMKELPKEKIYEENIKVRDQMVDGPCVAFSCAAIKDNQEYREWSNVINNFNEHFNPLFLYNLRSTKNSNGMIIREALDLLLNIGMALERDYPFNINDINKSVPKKVLKSAKRYTISGYSRITTYIGLQKAIYKNGPCIIGVPVYNYSKTFWKKGSPNERLLGYHAVCVIGYNEDGFILQNSWGSSWGDNGRTLLPYSDWNCVLEAWTTIDDIMASIGENLFNKKSLLDRIKKIISKIRLWYYNIIDKIISLFNKKEN